MKFHALSLFVCVTILPFAGYAQDTLFSRDPINSDVTYIEVRNQAGVITHSGRLVNGKREGVFLWYNAKNTIISVQEFHNDIVDGVWLKMGDNGAVEVEENYRNGQLEGKRVIYRFGGIKSSVEHFHNGKPEGAKTVYYDNGFKQEESFFKNGKREGVTKWYNQSEQVIIENTYKNGELDGPATTYFPDSGKPETIGQYKNGNEHGEWKKFDASGKHIESVFYDKGSQVKTVKY